MYLLKFSEVSKLLTQNYVTNTIKVYAGGPYELNIDYYDSKFYVSFVYENREDEDVYTGVSLYKTIKDKFKAAGYLSELQTEGLYVEDSEIENLRLDEECCSAEFQRMAPAHMIGLFVPGFKRKHKKDKYNKLGV